uniref:Putative serine recombinase n=1 Tax=Seminavis robusta TaxID=568900 RepID=A0A3S8PZG3_9STRA|nr:putative serine recombinase [Seminavis robusta]|eukprot:Sro51_chlor_g029940.1 ORF-61 (62) ;mRNA; r:58345-58530
MFEKIPKNCIYAYARVSSQSQENNSSLEAQKQKFIRVEVKFATYTIKERLVFQKLIDQELK